MERELPVLLAFTVNRFNLPKHRQNVVGNLFFRAQGSWPEHMLAVGGYICDHEALAAVSHAHCPCLKCVPC